MNPPPAPPGQGAPPPPQIPQGPPGGWGVGLPPGVDPMTGAGPGGGGPGMGSQQEPMAAISVALCVVAIPLWACCNIGSLAATITGVILGIVSLTRFKREPGRYTGRQLAIVGIVLNALFTLATLALWIFFVGFSILSSP